MGCEGREESRVTEDFGHCQHHLRRGLGWKVKVKALERWSLDVHWTIPYEIFSRQLGMSLDFGRKVQTGDVQLGVISLWMKLRARRLNEDKGARVHKEEKRAGV